MSLGDIPLIIWQGRNIGNYQIRDNAVISAVVQHRMGRDADGNLATMKGTKSWFENPKSKVSAHFGISLNGEIWQFVPVNMAAWANGILELPDMSIKWLADCVVKKINPNQVTVSIENEGDSAMVMPELQYQSNKSLTSWLLKEAGLKASEQTIIRHSQITGLQRANCPGIGFPMTRLRMELSDMAQTFVDPVTGYKVDEPFATFYRANGGLTIFGRPLANRLTALPGGRYGQSIAVQWFERARMEQQANGQILLGLVGRESYVSGF